MTAQKIPQCCSLRSELPESETPPGRVHRRDSSGRREDRMLPRESCRADMASWVERSWFRA